MSKAAARIDNPVDPTLVKELLNKFPDFRRAYTEDGLPRHHPKIAARENLGPEGRLFAFRIETAWPRIWLGSLGGSTVRFWP